MSARAKRHDGRAQFISRIRVGGLLVGRQRRFRVALRKRHLCPLHCAEPGVESPIGDVKISRAHATGECGEQPNGNQGSAADPTGALADVDQAQTPNSNAGTAATNPSPNAAKPNARHKTDKPLLGVGRVPMPDEKCSCSRRRSLFTQHHREPNTINKGPRPKGIVQNSNVLSSSRS